MLTEEMLPFLFQKWRQPNTIAKLRAERGAKTRIIQSQQVETQTVGKENVTKPQDPETSQNCIITINNESKSGDSSLHKSDDEEHEDDEEMEETEHYEVSMQEDKGSGNKEDLVSTTAKDCTLHLPKATYLDAVLQGKFNLFHVLGEHQEAVMMNEGMTISDDASQDTFKWTGSTAQYIQCISMRYGSTDGV